MSAWRKSFEPLVSGNSPDLKVGRAFLCGAAILFIWILTLAAAQAQNVGTAVICDTQEELEAVVAKVNQTRNLEGALAAVNAAYPSKENACGVGRVAYFPGKTAKTVWTVDGPRDIVEITVIAGATPDGMRAIRPIEQFTLFKPEGQSL
jgi:hypothetical protein